MCFWKGMDFTLQKWEQFSCLCLLIKSLSAMRGRILLFRNWNSYWSITFLIPSLGLLKCDLHLLKTCVFSLSRNRKFENHIFIVLGFKDLLPFVKSEEFIFYLKTAVISLRFWMVSRHPLLPSRMKPPSVSWFRLHILRRPVAALQSNETTTKRGNKGKKTMGDRSAAMMNTE